MDDLSELLREAPKYGSAQCPNCSKFAKVIRVVENSYPDGEYYYVVNCRRCGIQST
jgi:uncharacterized Zn finger protein